MENYKIIGGDGREYATSLVELREWIRDGRVGRDTLVWSADTAAWKKARELSELSEALHDLYGRETPPKIPDLRVGFWPRLGAFAVDWVLLYMMFLAIWPAVMNAFGIEQPEVQKFDSIQELFTFYQNNLPFMLKNWLTYAVLQLIYQVTLNGRFGATLGKMMIGARIVRADGTPISYGTAFFRWFAERLSGLCCYIGYLLIAFRQDKRALHDLLAGTQVIYKR